MSSKKSFSDVIQERDGKLESSLGVFEDMCADPDTFFQVDLGFDVNPEHFPFSKSASLCIFCGATPLRLDDHHRSSPTCLGKGFSNEQKKAARLYANGHMDFVSKGKLDLGQLSPATTMDAYERVQEIVSILKKSAFPVFGTYDPPSRSDSPIDRSCSSGSDDISSLSSNGISTQPSSPMVQSAPKSRSQSVVPESETSQLSFDRLPHQPDPSFATSGPDSTDAFDVDFNNGQPMSPPPGFERPSSSPGASSQRMTSPQRLLTHREPSFENLDAERNVEEPPRDLDDFFWSSPRSEQSAHVIQMNNSELNYEDPVERETAMSVRSESIFSDQPRSSSVAQNIARNKIADSNTTSQTANTSLTVPVIPRESQITSIYDITYSGGSSVHAGYLRLPDYSQMFCLSQDNGHESYIQARKYTGAALTAHLTLGLNRQLKLAQHSLLQDFQSYLTMRSDDQKRTAGLYMGFAMKFCLVLMRSRSRMGEELTADDYIFSGNLLLKFFENTSRNGIKSGTLKMYLKMLRHFNQFLLSRLDSVWMENQRERSITRLNFLLDDISISLNHLEQDEKQSRQTENTELIPYSIILGILRSPKVISVVDRIAASDMVTPSEFKFFAGFLMMLLIHSNSCRTDAIMKLQMRHVIPIDQKIDFYEEVIEGTKTDFWVLTYKNPKQMRITSTSGKYEGYLTLDRNMKHLFDQYMRLRESLNGSKHPKSRVFINYEDGSSISSADYLMHYFLEQIEMRHLKISCNKTRKYTTNLGFETYMKGVISKALIPEVAAISGHSLATREQHYVKSRSLIAVAGYCKLREIEKLDLEIYKEQLCELENEISISSFVEPQDNLVNTSEPTSLENEVPNGEMYNPSSDECVADSDEELNTSIRSPKAKRLRYARSESMESQMATVNSGQPSTSREYLATVTQASQDSVSDASSPIPSTLQIILTHNTNTCTSFPEVLPVKTPQGALDFVCRSWTTPIQNYRYLQIYDCGIIGRGVYASCEIPADTPLLDYGGKIAKASDHEFYQRNSGLTEEEKDFMADYKIEFSHKGEKYIAEGHQEVYRDRVVFGRVMNHTPHPECANVHGKPVDIVISGRSHLFIVFSSTKEIKSGHPLLWSYGPYFEQKYEWYQTCPNEYCPHKDQVMTPSYALTPSKTVQVPEISCKSHSQVNRDKLPIENEPCPLHTLARLAFKLNVRPSQLVFANPKPDIASTINEAFGLLGKQVDYQLLDELEESPQSLKEVLLLCSQVSDSFSVFVARNSRDKSIKCVQVGSSDFQLILVWTESTKELTTLKSVDGFPAEAIGLCLSHIPNTIISLDEIATF